MTDLNGPKCSCNASPLFLTISYGKTDSDSFPDCTHLKFHTLASASFLLESKASQVSVYEGPTDPSARKPGAPSANGCKLGASAWGVGQLASETGPGGAAWEQLVVEKGKKQLSLFLTFINPKIHKNYFCSRFLDSQEEGSCQP